MTELIIYLLSAFGISFLAFPLFIKLMESWKVFEGKDVRKIHTRDVPGLGGVPIVISAILTLLFFFPLEVLGQYKFLIASLFFMFLVGLRDDLLPLRPYVKVVNQIIPCVIVYYLFDIKITSFYSLLEIELPEYIALPLTIFTLIIITNSFNLIDGIDGLAGSLLITSLSILSGWFFVNGNETLSLFLIAFIGATAGFLYYNLPPARIFMGDTGALFSGFLVGCSIILFMNMNHGNTATPFTGVVGTAMSIIGVPLFDTFRIILYRLKSGHSPLSADRNHIHHMLLDIGWKHKHITATYVTLQLITIIIAFQLKEYNDWVLFLMMCLLYFGLLFLVIRKRRKLI